MGRTTNLPPKQQFALDTACWAGFAGLLYAVSVLYKKAIDTVLGLGYTKPNDT